MPRDFSLLALLQLADSALPVGSMSHSFGLEALVFDEDIQTGRGECPASLRGYLEDALQESLLVECVFCRESHSRALQNGSLSGLNLHDLNLQLSALRPARESREASLAMGRRFAALAAALHPIPALKELAAIEELHHSIAFGCMMAVIGIEADLAAGAFLHQSALNTISAAQRLLPLGQIQAGRIAWELKPAIADTVRLSREMPVHDVRSFAHLPELASMRHACLPSRLFIS